MLGRIKRQVRVKMPIFEDAFLLRDTASVWKIKEADRKSLLNLH